MQSKNSLFLLLVLALTGLSIFGYLQKEPAYGLDVKGGVRLTYQMDLSELTPEEASNTARLQSQLAGILETRVAASLGVVEGVVAAKGTDQLIVEIPDFQDIDQARELLKNTAKIQLFHAVTVGTEKRPQRRYVEAGQIEGGNAFLFARRSDSTKTFQPGDPEYDEMIDSWELILEGKDVTNAFGKVERNNTVPTFTFGGEGAANLERWSRRYANEGENLAFVLDGAVLSINPLAQGAILQPGGEVILQGQYSGAYVNQLTGLIKSGALPVPLIELESSKVDPTIGTKAFDQMIVAGGISIGIVCVFLIIYYGFPGIIAAIAMLLYALFTVTAMKWMGVTFSLAAVAAFILSLGMAADANILVFERMKEEMKAGRKLRSSVDIGFKRALSAIVDSNMCTIITSAVLMITGTSIVKGFATTLIVGVAISFFTAITVTRSLLVGLLSVGIGTNPKSYALNRNWFGESISDSGEIRWKIVAGYKKYFAVSFVVMGIGMVFVAMGGIKPNVEFRGGYEAQYLLSGQDISADQIRENLEAAGIDDVNIKFAETEGIRAVYLTLPETIDLPESTTEGVAQIAESAGITNTDNATIRRIGPTVRAETINSAILGVVISVTLIVAYLTIRFGVALGGVKSGIKFGLSSVVALGHDLVFLVGFAGIVGFTLGWEISALFITATLTVIGFSVHDTIVIFDRIRENLRRTGGYDNFDDVVDLSVNQSFARTINTSFTAILTLILLLFYGTPTPELKFMMATMLAGLVIGTYSSIFNAAQVLALWDKASVKRGGPKAGLVASARAEAKLKAAQVLAAPGSGELTVGDAAYGTIKRKSKRDEASHELDEE